MKRRFFTKLLLGAVAVPSVVKAAAKLEDTGPVVTVGLSHPLDDALINLEPSGIITTTSPYGGGKVIAWVNNGTAGGFYDLKRGRMRRLDL